MLNDDVHGDYNDDINDFDDDNDDEIDYDTNSRDNPLKEELDQIFFRLGG